MDKLQKQLSDILHAHFKEVGRIAYLKAQKAACKASWELHFGPTHSIRSDAHYHALLNRIRRFRDTSISDLWIDLDCNSVSDSEPEAYFDGDELIEPYLENTYHLTSKEVTKTLFGIVADYL